MHIIIVPILQGNTICIRIRHDMNIGDPNLQ